MFYIQNMSSAVIKMIVRLGQSTNHRNTNVAKDTITIFGGIIFE